MKSSIFVYIAIASVIFTSCAKEPSIKFPDYHLEAPATVTVSCVTKSSYCRHLIGKPRPQLNKRQLSKLGKIELCGNPIGQTDVCFRLEDNRQAFAFCAEVSPGENPSDDPEIFSLYVKGYNHAYPCTKRDLKIVKDIVQPLLVPR